MEPAREERDDLGEDRPEQGQVVAATEPAREERDDMASRRSWPTTQLTPQWSPLVKSGMTAGAVVAPPVSPPPQ